jgi:20S proteasome subunit alpha 6
MREWAIRKRLSQGRAIPVAEIVSFLGDDAQKKTQTYGSRPYGVGLLIIGVDFKGPHLFQFDPSGNFNEYVADAIGARSQMARTYLERNKDKFMDASRDDLIRFAMAAVTESMGQDKSLTVDNASVAVVGIKGEDFKIYEGQDIAQYLDDDEDEDKEDMEVDS